MLVCTMDIIVSTDGGGGTCGLGENAYSDSASKVAENILMSFMFRSVWPNAFIHLK